MGPSEVLPWAAAAVAAYLLLRVLQFARCAYHYLYTTSPSTLRWSRATWYDLVVDNGLLVELGHGIRPK